MPAIFSKDEQIADIPLSEKQLQLLASGEEITVIYHTPQLLRHVLGERSGAFSLQSKDGHITTTKPDAVRHFADLHKAIAAAKKVTDAQTPN